MTHPARSASVNQIDRSGLIRLTDAEAAIPGPPGPHSVSFLQRGTLNVKLSLPVHPNQQTPHAQDEIYVIVRGKERAWNSASVSPKPNSQGLSTRSQ